MTAYLQTVRLFNRNIVLYLCTAGLLGFTVDGGIYSVIFNLYLLRLGYDAQFVGQINAAGLLIFAIASLPLGMLGERWGNRRLMLIGFALMCAGCTLLPMVEFIPRSSQAIWLFATYLMIYLGMAHYYPNSTPYVMQIAAPTERNHVFSLQSAFWSFAAFAGSLIAGLLPGYFALALTESLAQPAPYRYPLWLAAVMLAPGLWAVLQMRPAGSYSSAAPSQETHKAPPAPLALYGLILLMALVRLLQVAGAGVVTTFFNVYLDAGLHVATAQIGLIVATGRLLAVLAALGTPFLITRWGAAQLTIWASLGVAVALVPLAYFPAWGAAGLGYVGVTTLTAIRYPAFLLYVMNLAPTGYRSTMAGAGETAAGVSFALMALIGGYLIDQQGYQNLFVLGAVQTVLGTLILWGYLRVRQRNGE